MPLNKIISSVKNRKSPYALLDQQGLLIYLNKHFNNLVEDIDTNLESNFLTLLNLEEDVDAEKGSFFSRLLNREVFLKPVLLEGKLLGTLVYFNETDEALRTLEKRIKSAAHDLNNINSSTVHSIELLKEKFHGSKEIEKLLYTIERNSLRSSEIVEYFLSGKKEHRYFLRRLKIDYLIGELVQSLEPSLKDIKLNYCICENPYEINADASALYRALLNICMNAKEAIQGKGRISIKVENADNPDDSKYRPRKYVVISVTDTGKGIKEEHFDKIFEPYFSTKRKKLKSGLGLDIVKEIVEYHDGYIDLSSEPNKGSTFSILLPAIEHDFHKLNGHRKKILIADDESSVRELLSELLDYYNYRPYEAVNGLEVIDKVVVEKDISLLIIDKNMPVVDGIECISRIRELGVTIPVILASGSRLEDDETEKLKDLQVEHILTKPYDFDQMRLLIESLIV